MEPKSNKPQSNPPKAAGNNQKPRPDRNGNGRGQRGPRVPDKPVQPVNKSVFNGIGGPSGKRVANQPTREPKLRVIPLGGLGEIGKNMTAFEYGDDIIVVDLGFAFPTAEEPGVDYMIPNIDYLEKNKRKVRGHIITHGHEDHIGATPFVLPKVPAPIYGARFTLGMIEKKLVEYKLQTQPQFRVMDPDKHERVQLGAFTVELIRVTHSIPDACAVLIETPVGRVIHTGDWRLDPDPVDGKKMDLSRLEQLGKEGVTLLLSDSTGCETLGRTPGEKTVEPALDQVFGRHTGGRIIVSAIASNIHRMQSIVNVAKKHNRKLAFVGRSMLANVELAVKLGYLKVPAGMIMRVQDMVRQPDKNFVILCTGHQGEQNSALNRMSTGDHPHVKVKPGDAVVLSSSIIPGNEIAIVHMVDGLLREGARVYQNTFRELDELGRIHCSGHAFRDDLSDLIKLTKPKYFMPVHGEFHHLVRHAELAVKCGMPRDNVYVFDNGDVLEITASSAKKGERVPAGVVMIDGTGIGDVEGIVLRDRLAMAHEGIFVIVATVSRRTGQLVASPDIISRGFIYMKENEELIFGARQEIKKIFDRRSTREPNDWTKIKLKLRDEISDYLYRRTKRNPMVITVINEV